MFSKFDPGLAAEKDKRVSAAVSRFFEAEERCFEANVRLANMDSWHLFKGVTTSSVLFTAARKISYLLGDVNLDEIAEGFAFGPGATTRLSRRRSDPFYKFGGIPETTSSNASFALAALRQVPRWTEGPVKGSKRFAIREMNRIVTVPKNAKTERMIAIEPCMNIYVQKGVGSVIRKRLKRVGIDLDDQTRNQVMARQGSIDGSLATIDLSMASDTVAFETVRSLLPPEWFCILEQMRTSFGTLPSGEIIRYQKFSSMGNGFTFELESLIFWAICASVVSLLELKDHRVGIYGDDLIVPTEAVEPLMKVLEFLGFKPNPKKTFVEGPFRESCGKHYFRGHDVTPFYVRAPVSLHSDLFLLHNNLCRWFYDADSGFVEFSEQLAFLVRELRNCADVHWRNPRLPLFGYGDGAFSGPFDVVLPSHAKRGWEGYRAGVLVSQKCTGEEEGEQVLLKSLYQLDRRNRYRCKALGSALRDGLSTYIVNTQFQKWRYVDVSYLSHDYHLMAEKPIEGSARDVLRAGLRATIVQIVVPRWDDVGWLAY
jgi:hypothetical protein